jgi:archaellum component FlaC
MEISQVMEMFKMINERLELIDSKIDIIDSKIDKLSRKTEEVEKTCDVMRVHIQFVESTYSVVRKPLNYLTNRINTMLTSNGSDVELPQIEGKKEN